MTEVRHGTPHGYNQGCREACCREANTSRAQERRRRLRALRKLVRGRWVSPFAEHGTLNGYGNWQCRCVPCTRVHVTNLKRLAALRKLRSVG